MPVSCRGRNGCSGRAAMRRARTALLPYRRSTGAPANLRSSRHHAGERKPQATHKLPFRAFDQPTAFGDTFAGMAVRDAASPAIAVLDDARPRIVRSASDLRLAAAMISKGRVMTFRSDDGRDVYGVFYAPANAELRGTEKYSAPSYCTRARRADVDDRARLQTARAVLHYTWLRRARSRLLRLDRLRAGLSRAARRTLGRDRRGGRRAGGAATRQARITSTARAWPSPEAAPVDTRC